jgi:exodeoxyribonuclease III
LPATFQFGGLRRSDAVRKLPVRHGDVAVWRGPSRFYYHGVAELIDGEHPALSRLRINLTFRGVGYGAVWNGQKAWNGVAIIARGADPKETRRSLPGGSEDTHSRYIEATTGGIVVGCLYLPNGNPAPGPKFDFELNWFERLTAHAAGLLASGAPVVLGGDYNVMPTEMDVYAPERWVDDALFRPEVRSAYHRLVEQGWTDSLRELHPGERIYTF